MLMSGEYAKSPNGYSVNDIGLRQVKTKGRRVRFALSYSSGEDVKHA